LHPPPLKLELGTRRLNNAFVRLLLSRSSLENVTTSRSYDLLMWLMNNNERSYVPGPMGDVGQHEATATMEAISKIKATCLLSIFIVTQGRLRIFISRKNLKVCNSAPKIMESYCLDRLLGVTESPTDLYIYTY
jgi:hypothetical protein